MAAKDLKLPVTEHLEEIRTRLFVVILFFIIFSGAAFYRIEHLLAWLKIPGGEYLGKLAAFSPTSAILTFVKMAFFFGLALSLPVLLFEVWMFIRPALDKSLSWLGVWFIAGGTALFIAGMLFSFYWLMPASLRFLLNLGRDELQFIISLESYISFVLLFMLAGGLIFEIPLLSFFLAKLNLITAEMMLRHWKIAVTGSLICAGLITPTPDVFNMMILALPMLFLYFISVGIVKLSQAKKADE